MLNRRSVLQAGLGVALVGGLAHAEEAPKSGAAKPLTESERALVDALSRCVAEGNLCLAHCVDLLSTGDTSLSDCARSVRDMLAVCAATQTLVSGSSARIKAAVQLCVDVCSDCETACRKHEGHHAICKSCAEACAAVVKTGRVLTA